MFYNVYTIYIHTYIHTYNYVHIPPHSYNVQNMVPGLVFLR